MSLLAASVTKSDGKQAISGHVSKWTFYGENTYQSGHFMVEICTKVDISWEKYIPKWITPIGAVQSSVNYSHNDMKC